MFRSSNQYHMLVASLPALPRIGMAERLPINEARLESRLRMLKPEDAEVARQLRRFIQWQNQTPEQTDEAIIGTYKTIMARIPQASVQSAIAFRINIRTLMAALRRRERGENEPPEELLWGAGDWVRHLSANWSHPDFKLAHVFPWLPRAREFFESGETLKLEELLMNLVWDDLDRAAFGRYFEFDAIIAYLFKWDILSRWLSYREEAALAQFETIASSLFPDQSSPSSSTSSAA